MYENKTVLHKQIIQFTPIWIHVDKIREWIVANLTFHLLESNNVIQCFKGNMTCVQISQPTFFLKARHWTHRWKPDNRWKSLHPLNNLSMLNWLYFMIISIYFLFFVEPIALGIFITQFFKTLFFFLFPWRACLLSVNY